MRLPVRSAASADSRSPSSSRRASSCSPRARVSRAGVICSALHHGTETADVPAFRSSSRTAAVKSPRVRCNRAFQAAASTIPPPHRSVPRACSPLGHSPARYPHCPAPSPLRDGDIPVYQCFELTHPLGQSDPFLHPTRRSFQVVPLVQQLAYDYVDFSRGWERISNLFNTNRRVRWRT